MDDTIVSKTKPSLRALHPIEDAYFHQSHLKGKQDYGHQAVAVMLFCNGIILNYTFEMYNKSISNIDIVHYIAKELPSKQPNDKMSDKQLEQLAPWSETAKANCQN